MAAWRGYSSGMVVSDAAVRWRRELPPTRDLFLAGLVAVVVQQDLWLNADLGHPVGPRPVVACFYLVTSLVLAWRRRAPLLVLAVVWAVGAAQYLAYGAPESLGIFLPPLIALYSAGRHAPTRAGLIAIPISVVGMAIHEYRDPKFAWSGSTFFFWAVLATAWPLGQAFRRRGARIGALAARTQALEVERDVSAREAITAERTRIARELHDVVGHGLSVVVLQLEAALGLLDNREDLQLRDRLVATQRSARLAMAEMRRLVGLLDDDDEDAALAPQPGLGELNRLVADTRAAGVRLDMRTTGRPVELPPGLDLAAFRVTQEALTNVLRHARPPVACLSVVYSPSELVVEVTDSGHTRVNGADEHQGRGITGMRERVALYGGELEVGRKAAGGFLVRAHFPIDGNRV